MGFGVWGLGFRVWGLGFGVWSVGFGVWGLGLRVWGLGFGVDGAWIVASGCRVQEVPPRHHFRPRAPDPKHRNPQSNRV